MLPQLPVYFRLERAAPLGEAETAWSRRALVGSFCDIGAALADVRFVPHSRRIAKTQLTSAATYLLTPMA
jgi:hypothetical protein